MAEGKGWLGLTGKSDRTMLGFPSSHTKPRSDGGSRKSRWDLPTWTTSFSSSSLQEWAEISFLFIVLWKSRLSNLLDVAHRWWKSKLLLLNRPPPEATEDAHAWPPPRRSGFKPSAEQSQYPDESSQMMKNGRLRAKSRRTCLFKGCSPAGFSQNHESIKTIHGLISARNAPTTTKMGDLILRQWSQHLHRPTPRLYPSRPGESDAVAPSAGPTQVTFHGWSLILSPRVTHMGAVRAQAKQGSSIRLIYL